MPVGLKQQQRKLADATDVDISARSATTASHISASNQSLNALGQALTRSHVHLHRPWWLSIAVAGGRAGGKPNS
jgi:hypothetical protein